MTELMDCCEAVKRSLQLVIQPFCLAVGLGMISGTETDLLSSEGITGEIYVI